MDTTRRAAPAGRRPLLPPPPDEQTPGTAPPLRWWLPAAAVAVAATVLSGLVIAFGSNTGPLDDPDQAYQRDGALHDGRQLAEQVGGVTFGGRTVIVLFERQLPQPASWRQWRAEVTRGGSQLVVALAGQAGTSTLRSAVGMRTPNDAGPPVGYALVDPDRRVRYATLDPRYLEHASEVDLLTADLARHGS